MLYVVEYLTIFVHIYIGIVSGSSSSEGSTSQELPVDSGDSMSQCGEPPYLTCPKGRGVDGSPMMGVARDTVLHTKDVQYILEMQHVIWQSLGLHSTSSTVILASTLTNDADT